MLRGLSHNAKALGVGVDDRLRGRLDYVPEALVGELRHVYYHAEPVHLLDHLHPERGEAGPRGVFPGTVGDPGPGRADEADSPEPEPVEGSEQAEVVLVLLAVERPAAPDDHVDDVYAALSQEGGVVRIKDVLVAQVLADGELDHDLVVPVHEH